MRSVFCFVFLTCTPYRRLIHAFVQYLENDDYSWTVTVHTISKPTISAAAVPDTRDAESVHYLYVCKKGGAAEEGA